MISLRKRRGSRYYGRGHTKDAHRGGHGMAGSKAHNKLWVTKVRSRELKIYKQYRDPVQRVLVSFLLGRTIPYTVQKKGPQLSLLKHPTRTLLGRASISRINAAIGDSKPFIVKMGSKSKIPHVDLVELLKRAGISNILLN
jgi:hypothetical protein